MLDPSSASPYDSASFRDPAARVFRHQSAVYRALSPEALAEWEALSAAPFWRRFADEGRVIATERADDALAHLPNRSDRWVAALRHQPIPVVSYPYEWPFGMLQDAALLQLDLLLAALADGFVLKDGTPFNVQWIGARPVFIDVASLVRLTAGSTWEGYRQFCELCLYPLMLQAHKNVDFHPLLRGRLDGITSEQCRLFFSRSDFAKPGVMTHVALQAAMDKRASTGDRQVKHELRQAGFSAALIAANARRLRKLVAGLRWRRAFSTWSDYTSTHSYEADDVTIKTNFVRDAVMDRHRGVVWDLGSNTGHFARLAAEHADVVLAVDADELSVERLYQAVKRDGPPNILPLVANLADPAPGLGWLGRERLPLVDRNRPDLVLCLALIHHVALSSNVPMADFVDWLASLGADLVIEFVSKDDAMSRRLLRNKEDVFTDYGQAAFEARLEQRFRVVRRQALHGGTRVLYYGVNKARTRD